MGLIASTARRLADEGNSIDVIIAMIESMENGSAPPRKGKDGSPRMELERVLCPQTAQDVLDYRQRLRAPLTARAARELAKQFELSQDPEGSASMMMLKGWRAYQAGWGAQSNVSSINKPQSAVERRRAQIAERVQDGYGSGREAGVNTDDDRRLSFFAQR